VPVVRTEGEALPGSPVTPSGLCQNRDGARHGCWPSRPNDSWDRVVANQALRYPADSRSSTVMPSVELWLPPGPQRPSGDQQAQLSFAVATSVTGVDMGPVQICFDTAMRPIYLHPALSLRLKVDRMQRVGPAGHCPEQHGL